MQPDKAERRPVGGTGAQSDAHGGGITSRITAKPFRRRRAAAWRLPPLADSRRDPLDSIAGLPVRRPPRCARAVLGTDGRWRQCCRGDAA
jgi:hypothetical protein